ncbi:hypothetical protein F2Q69_00005928 [Brassica cretica]|uniref:Uncharacterized protein n=1 Tax=Brassica cretica TaxID=69181 RepID=A0A8S9P2G6_BRACR|nr:hypothetical protein F2Q69_00005928 [Brassica cretica]
MVDSKDRYSTEKASSVKSTILYDCEAEALSVEVLLDTPPGSPKNCPEARGGSVRVQISLSRPVSFFMVKPRLCPRQDQSSPFQSRRPLGFGQVLSDQPAVSRLEHLQVPVIFKDSVVAGGRTIWVIPRDCVSSVMPTAGAKPANARHEDRILPVERRNTKLLGPELECCVVLVCRRGLWNPRVPVTLSYIIAGGQVTLGKDDRIAWCWTLGPPE